MVERGRETGPSAGLFITFEGAEGTGKTTQIARVANSLENRGLPVFRTREPGGTRIGERIREILLATEHGNMVSMTELFLYEACRAQLVVESIRKELVRGCIVLCDRFSDATMAYQGYGRGLDRDLIGTLNRIAVDGTDPDLTLLLDCPAEQGLERVRGRIEGRQGKEPSGPDRLEAEELAFHERVRNGYLAIAAGNPARIRVVDTCRGEDSVHEEVMVHISRLLSDRGL
jgi:dTMP kinase